MDNWKAGLDRYLSASPPEDGFTEFIEAVIDNLSEDFYNKHEDWVNEDNGDFIKWMNELSAIQADPKEIALIIEKRHTNEG